MGITDKRVTAVVVRSRRRSIVIIISSERVRQLLTLRKRTGAWLITASCRRFHTTPDLYASRHAANSSAGRPPLLHDWSAGWRSGRSEERWGRQAAALTFPEASLVLRGGAPRCLDLQTTLDKDAFLRAKAQVVASCHSGNGCKRLFGPIDDRIVLPREQFLRALQTQTQH
jgi:hypothetical protein